MATGRKSVAGFVDYKDQNGRRCFKQFKTKRDAIEYETTVRHEVRQGTHVPDAQSITIKRAGELWIERVATKGRQRTTIDQYDQHLRLHINPQIGAKKLSRFNAPDAAEFEDWLLANGRSQTLTKYIMRSLGMVFAEAQRRGKINRNPVRDLPRNYGAARKRKLEVGIDIPTPEEIRAIIAALDGRGPQAPTSPPKEKLDKLLDELVGDLDIQPDPRWRPFFLTAIFTGLRSSELRGLQWQDVDLVKGQINVRRRADKYKVSGAPKTDAGYRTVPLPPHVVNALKQWKLQYPRPGAAPDGALEAPRPEHLVFGNGAGRIEDHPNIIERGLKPLMVRAGVTAPVLDEHGRPAENELGLPIVRAKYTGLHALRHFYASWCINSPKDGGLGLDAKRVQALMGHSSIVVTLDTYGHLFPAKDDGGAALADASVRLIG